MSSRWIAGKKIGIVGGGPGGLTLARLLQKNGVDVRVFERDLNRNVRVQGATLDLHHESGLAALREAGLMEAFMANYRPGADLLRIVDKQANMVYDQHSEDRLASFVDEHYRPEIDRGPLRNILLDSLEPGTVVWYRHTESLEKTEDGWTLHFQNGKTAEADIVIGADGANSKIRPVLTPIKPFYTGFTAVEGGIRLSSVYVPKVHEMLRGGKLFAMGDEKTLIVSSKGDGSLAFYLGFAAPEFWQRDCGIDFSDNESVLAWFKRDFPDWNPIWLELFETEQAHFTVRPLYCMPLDQTWESRPDITLLGDAAHLMPPYAGEGVNMAMLDALELSRCLTGGNFDDLQSAISSYETEMRKRGSEAAKESLDNTRLMHSANSIANVMAIFEGGNP